MRILGIAIIVLILSNSVSLLPNVVPVLAMEGLLPQYEPIQHVSSNPNLYVSVENPLFKNYFAGPMVVEVVVSDPNINRLDEAYGEPLVTVNGHRLRLAQATDGNWYGYFADRNQAEIAARTAPVSGHGLNFGWFCGPDSNVGGIAAGLSFSETKGFTMARQAFLSTGIASNVTSSDLYSSGYVKPASPFLANFPEGGSLVNNCDLGTITSVTTHVATTTEHVVRYNKTLNANSPGFAASAAYEAAWPIIQLYDFSAIPTPVAVDYHAAGGDQIVNLTFDRIPSNEIAIVSNRPDFPRGAQVQGDLIDPQLNVDPTDLDSWTWGTSPSNNTLYYMAFDDNGKADSDGLLGTGSAVMPSPTFTQAYAMQNLIGNLTSMMFNHNGRLLEDAAPQGVIVAALQSNGIQHLFPDSNGYMRTQSISAFSIPITGREISPNAGIFGDYDAGGISDLVILNDAPRDKSFTITYNDISYSIVVKFHDATLTMGWPQPSKNGTK